MAIAKGEIPFVIGIEVLRMEGCQSSCTGTDAVDAVIQFIDFPTQVIDSLVAESQLTAIDSFRRAGSYRAVSNTAYDVVAHVDIAVLNGNRAVAVYGLDGDTAAIDRRVACSHTVKVFQVLSQLDVEAVTAAVLHNTDVAAGQFRRIGTAVEFQRIAEAYSDTVVCTVVALEDTAFADLVIYDFQLIFRSSTAGLNVIAIPLGVVQPSEVVARCRIAIVCRVFLVAQNGAACGNLAFRAIQFDLVVVAAGRNGGTVAIDIDLLGSIAGITQSDVIIQINLIVSIYGDILTGLSFRCVGCCIGNVLNITDVSSIRIRIVRRFTVSTDTVSAAGYVFDLRISGIDTIFIDGDVRIFNGNLVGRNAIFIDGRIAGGDRAICTKVDIFI